MEILKDVVPVLRDVSIPQKTTITRTVHLCRTAHMIFAAEFLQRSEYLSLCFDGSRKGNDDLQG